MHPFSTPCKHGKTWCFQGVEKGFIGNKCVKNNKEDHFVLILFSLSLNEFGRCFQRLHLLNLNMFYAEVVRHLSAMNSNNKLVLHGTWEYSKTQPSKKRAISLKNFCQQCLKINKKGCKFYWFNVALLLFNFIPNNVAALLQRGWKHRVIMVKPIFFGARA